MSQQAKTLFVYYKVPLEQRASFKASVLSELGERIQSHPGLRVQLLQRPEASKEGLETWMEIYEHHERGIDSDLEQALMQSFDKSALPFKRMIEVFLPLR